MIRGIKVALFIAIVGLGLLLIGETLIDDNQFAVQNVDIPKNLEVSAMDHLMAEDLSMTTSMFLKQLSVQMQRWAERDLSTGQLQEEFEEELKEHAHFNGFAILKNDKVIVEAGHIKEINPDNLTHRHMNSQFSDPYQIDGHQYMLMGERLDNGLVVLGEVKLSFVKDFVKGLASVADANGTFFVSGDYPSVNWKTTDDLPENLESEVVPELGWQIVVHSEGQSIQSLDREYIEKQAVIKFKHPETASVWFADQPDLTIIENKSPLFLVESANENTIELIQRLKRDYDLAIVEPNYTLSKQVGFLTTVPKQEQEKQKDMTPLSSIKPNDEFFRPYQWNLNQIETDKGWSLSSGDDVVIAVLDTGVDPNHLDLKGKLVHGYNAFDDSLDFTDQHGHGTHVAGIAAALTNNVTGIAGVSAQSRILPVKVLNENGEGSSYEVAKGIYWAVQHGADVINMSLGDYHSSDILYDAIRYAYEEDVVLIAASGNDNVADPMYPSNYKEVLTVSAVNDARNRAFFSNFGNHVDVAAPGEHIPSLFPDNNYVVMSGTSMAAPHVAGLAGLIRSFSPELTNKQVYEVITSTATDLGTRGYDPYYGFGEIDVEAALRSLK
ncbi:S8 family peptidase [Bacillus suaedae]|uniref:Peptidase S8 n=1 Tax=Halalkalibacter suaedae TaxID=2822140 RepID=A0A940WVE2_9BACI|nr:S8 family peptidase [Bacillus suaedae]MBP3951187.1 peptidase S8 [Bacillus suaedae]